MIRAVAAAVAAVVVEPGMTGQPGTAYIVGAARVTLKGRTGDRWSNLIEEMLVWLVQWSLLSMLFVVPYPNKGMFLIKRFIHVRILSILQRPVGNTVHIAPRTFRAIGGNCAREERSQLTQLYEIDSFSYFATNNSSVP